jgi:hypothetical protein
MNTGNHFDPWSLLVIVITLGLFLIALFTRGFTHDLLLEAGVFLVSVKLILMGYKNSASNDSIQQKLDEIRSAVQSLERTHGPERVTPPAGPRSARAYPSGPPSG